MTIGAKILTILFAIFVMASAVGLPFLGMNSDSDPVVAYVILGLPAGALIGGGGILATFVAVRRGQFRARMAIFSFSIILAVGAIAYTITQRCLVPSNLRFDFSYPGNTGTYREVQFYFKHNGQWLEGPSVEAWPLTVSFPDLNGDGCPDIRVVPNEGRGAVEFIYLPHNDGHSFWQPLKNDSGLSAAYEPARYFSNYP